METETKAIEKPEGLEEKHLEYLAGLRESGVTNMLGAGPYLMEAYPDLTEEQADEIHIYWMKTFKR